MSAASRLSRPEKLAQQIEKLPGWSVERSKEGAYRTIRAQHTDGRVTIMTFVRTSVAPVRDVFAGGERFVGTERFEVSNVSATLREMAAPPDVPFKIGDPSEEILAAVAGKTVTWRNRTTGKIESATAPRGGVHLTLKHPTVPGAPTGERVLSFPSKDGGGFRSLRLDQIVKVS